MPERKRARNTRDRLLDAAETIVARDGVTHLTFDAVAAHAQVSKGTALYHFACKEDLTTAMIERFVGRFDAHGASVGLAALPATHPLCGGSGTDNRVAVVSDRYPRQPLVIQGPGAGAEVTAAALLDDVLRISAG